MLTFLILLAHIFRVDAPLLVSAACRGVTYSTVGVSACKQTKVDRTYLPVNMALAVFWLRALAPTVEYVTPLHAAETNRGASQMTSIWPSKNGKINKK